MKLGVIIVIVNFEKIFLLLGWSWLNFEGRMHNSQARQVRQFSDLK